MLSAFRVSTKSHKILPPPICSTANLRKSTAITKRMVAQAISSTLYRRPLLEVKGQRLALSPRALGGDYFFTAKSWNSLIVGPSDAFRMFSRTTWAVTGSNFADQSGPRVVPL